MSLLGLPPISPQLKSILPYLQRAQEVSQQDPIIAYWCAYHAAQLGIAIKAKDPASRDVLFALLTTLENMKKQIGPHDALDVESVSSAYVENFALKVFVAADNEDRAGKATRSTAKKFLAAANFLEILKTLSESRSDLSETVSEKIRYAKWKAADIAKAFREGQKPTPGPAISNNQPEESELAPSVLPIPPEFPSSYDSAFMDTRQPSSGSYPVDPHLYLQPPSLDLDERRESHQHHPSWEQTFGATADHDPVVPSLNKPRSGSGSSSIALDGRPERLQRAWASEELELDNDYRLSNDHGSEAGVNMQSFANLSPSAPPSFQSHQDTGETWPPAPSSPFPGQLPSPSAPPVDTLLPGFSPDLQQTWADGMANHPPHTSVYHHSSPQMPMHPTYHPRYRAPSPPRTESAELSPTLVAKIQKHCRFAISALDYEDAETARKELRTALALLG